MLTRREISPSSSPAIAAPRAPIPRAGVWRTTPGPSSLCSAPRIVAACGLSLLFILVWTQYDARSFVSRTTFSLIDSLAAEGAATTAYSTACFINIYGLHHSGTGVTREMVLRMLPPEDTATFRNTGLPEDEGQHLQDVYPLKPKSLECLSVDANEATARNHTNVLDLYVCSSGRAKYAHNRGRPLHRLWEPYYDRPGARFRVQKSPTMKISIVDDLLKQGSASAGSWNVLHVLALRHPMYWRWPMNPYGAPVPSQWTLRCDAPLLALCSLSNWLRVWSFLLQDEDTWRDRKVFVSRVESFASIETSSLSQMARWFHQECPAANGTRPAQGRRALELRTWTTPVNKTLQEKIGLPSSNFFLSDLLFAEKGTNSLRWKACLLDAACCTCLELAEVGVNALGYSVTRMDKPVRARAPAWYVFQSSSASERLDMASQLQGALKGLEACASGEV